MPRPTSWLDTGPENWLGGWAESLAGLRGFQSPDHKTPLGISLASTLAVLAGLSLARHRASTRLLATAAVVLALCLTPLPPGLVIFAERLLILGPLAFAYVGRKDHPLVFPLVVGLVLSCLILKGYTDDFLLGCGLYTLLIAAGAFVTREDDRREGLVLGPMILGISWVLFRSPLVMGLGAVFGGLLAGVAALAGHRSRRRIEAVILGGFLAFAGLVSFEERPGVWLLALVAPIAVLAARWTPIRPPARSLPHLLLVGLGTMLVFNQGGSAWVFLFLHVPGASSMIFVSRVGLILLIPAAIGLGYALDALRAKGRRALAMGLGLVCLLEQGATTPSFDKHANREVIGALARRIDGQPEAFYYTPDELVNPVLANLDAMWAGVERSKPTLNGYSGHTPVGWREIDEPRAFLPDDLRKLVIAMDRWKGTVGRPVAGVQWIGGPEDRPGRFPEAGAGVEAEGDSRLNPTSEGTSSRSP